MKLKSSGTQKAFSILITVASMFLYYPINRLISGGHTFETPLDNLIPVIPIFVIPYLFGNIFWFVTIIYVNLTQNAKISKIFNFQIIVAGIISAFIYVTLPTFVNRPIISGTDMFSNILNFVYGNDNVYNAAPSGHTFYTIICLFVLLKIKPKQKLLWIILSALIIVSTLFTKQHNILDALTGLVFAATIIYSSRSISHKLVK